MLGDALGDPRRWCRRACPFCWLQGSAPLGTGGCAAPILVRPRRGRAPQGRARHDALACHLLACAATYLTQLAGYAVPAHWLGNPRTARLAGAITVALLSALRVMNTFSAGTALVLDARLEALAVDALALWPRLPFLLVVVLGAAAAGLVRVL